VGTGAALLLTKVGRLMWMVLRRRKKIRVQIGNLEVEVLDGVVSKKALGEGGHGRWRRRRGWSEWKIGIWTLLALGNFLYF
jgi:hypothetical protein